MKESLKYGLLTGLGYCAIVGVIHLVGLCIGLVCVLLSGGIVFLCPYIKNHKCYQNI